MQKHVFKKSEIEKEVWDELEYVKTCRSDEQFAFDENKLFIPIYKNGVEDSRKVKKLSHAVIVNRDRSVNLDNVLKLWWQVLVVALEDAVALPDKMSQKHDDRIALLRRKSETTTWFESKEFEFNSFLGICETLDLDPVPIKSKALRYCHETFEELKARMKKNEKKNNKRN
ncbi:MAG: hypothetical protein GWN93_26880 [Deltaproteobacteria bacterium]|nr:hypothetical protein [Deltaproteobacteria bacterium]